VAVGDFVETLHEVVKSIVWVFKGIKNAPWYLIKIFPKGRRLKIMAIAISEGRARFIYS
jgi:hypothetical protein